MTLKSKFKIENPVVFLFSVFYVIAGLAELFYIVISNFTAPPHIGVLGLLNLLTAYSVFKMKRWSVPLVIALFFLGITFGAPVLYYSITQPFEGTSLFQAALIAYLLMALAASIYVTAKREKFTEPKTNHDDEPKTNIP
jgi:hypothetical protein